MLDGWTVCADKEGIKLTKGQASIHFDIPVHTKEGVVWCTCYKRKQLPETQAVATDKEAKVSLSKHPTPSKSPAIDSQQQSHTWQTLFVKLNSVLHGLARHVDCKA